MGGLFVCLELAPVSQATVTLKLDILCSENSRWLRAGEIVQR